MKKQSLLLILLAVALLALSACSPAATTTAVAPAEAAQPEVLIAEGRLMPRTSIDASFTIPGQVAEVLVQAGDSVSAGQVLARLSPAPEASLALARARQELLATQQALDVLKSSAAVNLAQARLARVTAEQALEAAQERYDEDQTDENQAQLEAADAQLEQAEEMLKTLETGAGIDPDQRAALEARLASAEAGLASAQAAVDARELKATLAGTVVDVAWQPGQNVTAGQPGITIADFTAWVVHTDNLTESDVVQVSEGQQVSIILDALPNQPLAGSVSRIDLRYAEKRGDITYTVEAVLSQSVPQMRWGMTAAVQFLP